jgi:aminoglycoside phosphotransferase (APT) family kinase protein
VLRRPPLGHVLATAHDMTREHTVISALAASAVPVPSTVALCSDPGPLGAPFYLMQRADGQALRTRADLLAVAPQHRERLARRLVATLADLHAVDPERAGLGDFGRPDGFMARQVSRWSRQLAASTSRELAGIVALREGLAARVPAAQGVAVVHGDFRLDNVLVDGAEVTAVLDWEMSTLGDPLADVGLLAVYWGTGSAHAGLGPVAALPATVEGFPDAATMAGWYAELTGRDLTRIPWYVAFGYFKLAVILEGIHYRYTQGLTVGPGFDQVGQVVPGLVAAGLEALADDQPGAARSSTA